MTTAVIGTNVNISVQETLGADKTISALTQASPGVATSTSHGFANGDLIKLTIAGGMVELDGQAVRVANVTTDTFELEGLDTTSYSTFTSGTANKVTALQTLSKAQNITMPNPAPNKIDITTLLDKVKQYAFGLTDAPDGTISGLFNPTGTAEGLVRAATKANGTLVIKVAFPNLTAIFNAYVSGGTGFDLQTNQAATATISFTPVRDVMYY